MVRIIAQKFSSGVSSCKLCVGPSMSPPSRPSVRNRSSTSFLTSSGVPNGMDYHRLDIFTMAWAKLRGDGLPSFRLDSIAQALGIAPEPMPHRAVNGARAAYEVYRKLIALP